MFDDSNYLVGSGTKPTDLTPVISSIASEGVLRVTGPDKTRLVVSDPELIKDIAIRRADVFIKPPIYSILNLFGPTIVSLNDAPWKRHRVIADPAFAEDHMDFLTKSSHTSTSLLIDSIQSKSTKGRLVIDVHSEMQLVTLDIIGKVRTLIRN